MKNSIIPLEVGGRARSIPRFTTEATFSPGTYSGYSLSHTFFSVAAFSSADTVPETATVGMLSLSVTSNGVG